MTKVVYKYATGEAIPEGAIYCSTLVEIKYQRNGDDFDEIRLVWHYFLVEAKQ